MIVINGENRQEMQGKTIEFLLEEMGLKKEQVAVEVNESITDKSLYEKTIINDGDIIEVVSFVGGGSLGYEGHKRC